MADDDEVKDPPKEPPMPNPDHATKAELEAHKREMEQYRRELKEELETLHQSDHAEREELRTRLEEAETYIADLKKAESERDKVKDSKTTMVLPPNDIPPQQSNPAPPSTHETAPDGTVKRRSLAKRIW